MLKAYRSAGDRLQNLDVHTDAAVMSQAIWFDMQAPAPEELALVTRQTGLSLPEPEDIVEIEISSRLNADGNTLTVTMPIVSREPDGLRSSACGFVLSPDRLITIRLAPSMVFEQFIEHPHNFGEAPSAALFTALLEAITYRQADALEHLRADLDKLSHLIFHHRFAGIKADTAIRGRSTEAALQETLITLGRDYDTITFLRDSQLGVGRIAGYVGSVANWLPKPIRERLRALEKDVASLNEFSTHLTDKVQFLLDTTLGLINIAQNSLIKVLTIVSIVGIPPTLIAGIYGMNFKDIPELNWSFGYGYAWGLMILSAILPLAWFRKKGWV